ncbi:MAG: ABC transporter substrate-binding protein, partial [Acidimicrobiia bacterium]|nr:ABC transporter substrate-binding protein [Acidimicrobiia bacterium]
MWGRKIDLRLVEVSALGGGGVDIDTLRNAACIEATENHDGVIVMNTTTFAGTAQLCITEEHDSVLIGHEALPAEYLQRGGGRLFTTATTVEEIFGALAKYVTDNGALEGRRVGVVAPNTPGEAEAVEGGLVATLQALGVDVRVFDVLDCAGTSFCVGGMAESVQRLIEEDVDVLFPTLNAVSLPGYINEMVTQGFRPGDVQIYNSDFNSQGNEVVADLILTFGGAAAGELYDGTVLLVTTDQGRFRDPGWEPSAFGEMCMREYREYSATGEDYDPRDPVETNKYGILALVCSVYRVALRAVYDAGPNPGRADIAAAMENLGPVDLPFMLPASLAPGKWSMGDSLQPVTFR